jgi:hypothetical protein
MKTTGDDVKEDNDQRSKAKHALCVKCYLKKCDCVCIVWRVGDESTGATLGEKEKMLSDA